MVFFKLISFPKFDTLMQYFSPFSPFNAACSCPCRHGTKMQSLHTSPNFYIILSNSKNLQKGVSSRSLQTWSGLQSALPTFQRTSQLRQKRFHFSRFFFSNFSIQLFHVFAARSLGVETISDDVQDSGQVLRANKNYY